MFCVLRREADVQDDVTGGKVTTNNLGARKHLTELLLLDPGDKSNDETLIWLR